MKYFYIHPFKPQYFFPFEFRKHDLFLNFFNSYSFVGGVSWFLFKRFSVYRWFFSIKNIEDYIPEHNIKKIIGNDSIMAFNKGTMGPEQKITGLGVSNKNEFFFKYGQTKIAKVNVQNEYCILKQIEHLDFVPKVINFYKDKNQVLLKTSVLKGNRLKYKVINNKIVDLLFLFSKQKVECNKTTSIKLQCSFAHGDFCPWNLMIHDGQILVFDWEMAGNFTLGYDLFTYIFQTQFLLNANIQINNIISDNINAIKYYFSKFNIKNWKTYLTAFAKDKIRLEQLKGSKGLINEYLILLDYSKKM